MVKNSLRSLFGIGFPKAVIWDMDGVLSETMMLHNEALRTACQKHDLSIPDELFEQCTGRADGANLVEILIINGFNPEEKINTELIALLKQEKNNLLINLINEREL